MNQATRFSGVRFHPWVGKHYRSSMFGVRLLVLGESHYGNDGDDRPEFTQEVVRCCGQQRRSSFFTRIAQVLLGRTDILDNQSRAGVWDHIAFYNYVQTLLPGPRIPPPHDAWEAAATSFRVVLGELQPDAVLVLGERLCSQIKWPHDVLFAHILHPSSRMRVPDSIPVLEELLRSAGAGRNLRSSN